MSIFNDIDWSKGKNVENCISNVEKVKSIGALSRGILKRKRGKETIHFNGDSTNTELLFQTIQCANHLNICSSGEFVLSVDNKILSMVEPEEVQLSVSPPTQAPGNRMHKRVR